MRTAVQVGLNRALHVNQQNLYAPGLDSQHLSDPQVIKRHDLIPLHG